MHILSMVVPKCKFKQGWILGFMPYESLVEIIPKRFGNDVEWLSTIGRNINASSTPT